MTQEPEPPFAEQSTEETSIPLLSKHEPPVTFISASRVLIQLPPAPPLISKRVPLPPMRSGQLTVWLGEGTSIPHPPSRSVPMHAPPPSFTVAGTVWKLTHPTFFG